MSAFDVKLQNVGLMEAEKGFNVTIVCTSDDQQAAYWQRHLDSVKGKVTPSESTVLAVDEDWPGGAGNFLGTLYAWRKACAKLRDATGRDLAQELEAGASVAIYHTAGKGTRMSPLPGSENNNKPGVKMPAPAAPSILEGVIRQTGSYAASRKSRVSVFWGDQIFVPSVSAEYTPRHHADILCGLGPMPSAEEWERRGLEQYGLIAEKRGGSVAAQLDKVSHAVATEQLSCFDDVERVGASLGSFSVSAQFLFALDAHFSVELDSKEGKMDSDPHLWMPITVGKEGYTSLMVKKGIFDEAAAAAHHDRICALITSFDVSSGGLSGIFGAVDCGLDLSWWDYGLLKLYLKNSLLLTTEGDDAVLARKFFGIPEVGRVDSTSNMSSCNIDAASVVSASRVNSGSVLSSAIVGVTANELNADGAVLVNVCARQIRAGKGSIAYNILDTSDGGIELAENEVRVGVFTTLKDCGYFEMKSNVAEVDGGKVFKEAVCGNARSFEEVYDLNRLVNVSECAELAAAERKEFAATL